MATSETITTCDDCGCAGVHTSDLDALTREDGLAWLMSGYSDGSALHRTLCDDCSESQAGDGQVRS